MKTTRLAVAAALVLLCLGGCSSPRIHARLGDGHGLAEGATVTMSGVRIGSVEAVRVEGDAVDVAIVIEGDHDIQLHEGACAYAVHPRGQSTQLVLLSGESSATLRSTEIPIPECSPGADLADALEQLGEGIGGFLRSVGTGLAGGGSSPIATTPIPIPVPIPTPTPVPFPAPTTPTAPQPGPMQPVPPPAP